MDVGGSLVFGNLIFIHVSCISYKIYIVYDVDVMEESLQEDLNSNASTFDLFKMQIPSEIWKLSTPMLRYISFVMMKCD